MRKLILFLIFIMILAVNYASFVTLVEVTINSVKIPSMCTYANKDNIDIQARIATGAYIQVGTFNNPIARSRNIISVRQGQTGYVSYLNDLGTGSPFLAFTVNSFNSFNTYNQNCVRLPTDTYVHLGVSCVNNSGTVFSPCTVSTWNFSDNIAVSYNCKRIDGQELVDAYCMNLN